MDALKVEDMYGSFGSSEALKGISSHVTEGEVLAALSPSGSGKSTLLRCITFSDYADSGRIEYFGQVTLAKESGVKTPKGGEKRPRHDYGLVSQNFNLFPHWTVIRNLCDAPIKVQKHPSEKVRTRAKHLLGRMNLPDKGGAYPSELSGSQKQRVAIVHTLALYSKMLYFDEPVFALDPELIGEILTIIRSLAEEQVTMVIVTHEMEFAAGVAGRAMFMDGDTVLEEGVADELTHRPTQECIKQLLSKLCGEVRSY